MENLTTELLEGDPAELAKLDPETLDALYWKANEELTTAKRREGRLHQALELRYSAKASQALLSDNRDTGTVHFADGSYEVTVTRPKRVKWDQERLREALDTIPPEAARHIASVQFKIDERRYDASMDDVKAALAPARTVETGKASYALEKRRAA